MGHCQDYRDDHRLPDHTAEVDELQLLFREAKQRRRRRWLISGIATLAFLVVVGMVVGLS